MIDNLPATGNKLITLSGRLLGALVWLPWLWLEVVNALGGGSWTLTAFLTRGAVIGATVGGHILLRRLPGVGRRVAVAAGSVVLLWLGWWLWPHSSWVAGGWLVAFFVFLLTLATVGMESRSLLAKLAISGFWGVGVGSTVALVVQVENQFADEEFSVVVQAIVITIFWLLILWASQRLSSRYEPPTKHHSAIAPDRRMANLGLIVAVVLAIPGALWSAGRYQRSFFPSDAPHYPGISQEFPFLCGEASTDQASTPPVDGEVVFSRLLKAAEANPRRGVLEFGMLALGSKEGAWAEAFRDALLEEARAGLYTGPAQSIKYGQYLAAKRAYYYPRVLAAFPDLFTPAEQAEIEAWFHAINRRSLTAEWVDWLYGLALGQAGEGPYVNQEIGAGLLAVLTAEGLADPALAEANQAYLASQDWGWAWRFRYPDDAYVYQGDWITEAAFLAEAGIAGPDWRRANAFEWILLQALPTGDAPRYNHPLSASLATIAYFGALQLEDPRFLWLTNRSLDVIEAAGSWIGARPGADSLATFQTEAPTVGSCLIYGDSGLPNQAGPLAPDKIVLRDGWAADSAYVLQNLRFTGWHRYKATGSISLVYQAGKLAEEVQTRQAISWLPAGRSLVRDKRTPRENMNGLLVPRQGMDALLFRLTGMGGAWAQDPPYYANVVAFDTGDDVDQSHIRLEDWQGWQHDRQVFLYHDGGPIVVVDHAQRVASGSANSGLTWHLNQSASGLESGQPSPQGTGRFVLRGADAPVEFGMIFVSPAAQAAQMEMSHSPSGGGSQLLNLTVEIPAQQSWTSVSYFLFGQWANATVSVDEAADPPRLHIRTADQEITLPLPNP